MYQVRPRRMRRTPRTTVGGLAAPGTYGTRQVEGALRPGPGGPLTAPLTGTPCVWYKLLIEEYAPGFPSRTSNAGVYEQATRVPFGLDDGTGQALVDAPWARIEPGGPALVQAEVAAVVDPARPDARFRPGTLADRVRLARLPGPPPDLRPGTHYRYQEWTLPVGTAAYVLGGVHPSPGGVVLGRPERGALLVGIGPAPRARTGFRGRLWIGYDLGVPCAVLGFGALAWQLVALLPHAAG